MVDILTDPNNVRLLGQFVADACGVQLGADKGYLFQSRLGPLLLQSGAKTVPEFLQQARTDPTGKLKDRIIDAMTTHETYWFRDERPWAALESTVLPELSVQLRSPGKTRLRIFSAACSTGQEPYSVAMIIDQLVKNRKIGNVQATQFEIIATDVSAGTLYLASRGIYNQIEISRGLAERWRTQYFQPAPGNTWQLAADLRQRVTFKRHNLQNDFGPLGKFDLILLRNVAIYFEDKFKQELFRRLHAALNPQGFLMLGASEALLSHTELFKREFLDGAVFYRRIG